VGNLDQRWALSGTKLAFSGLIKREADASRNELWSRAVSMGAYCTDAVEPDTTHLVTKPPPTTDKCKMAALVPGCRIVNVAWLRSCFKLQQRVDETPHLLAKVLEASTAAAAAREAVSLDQASIDAMDDEVAALMAEDSSDDDAGAGDGEGTGVGGGPATDTRVGSSGPEGAPQEPNHFQSAGASASVGSASYDDAVGARPAKRAREDKDSSDSGDDDAFESHGGYGDDGFKDDSSSGDDDADGEDGEVDDEYTRALMDQFN
jgi:hypothetical protein